jgi:Tat protein secretion system quality control protein TatD with DNase activity
VIVDERIIRTLEHALAVVKNSHNSPEFVFKTLKVMAAVANKEAEKMKNSLVEDIDES